jgi:predicted nucleic-acid-binding protein
MNIIADTNVLLRAVLGDDAKQSRVARLALSTADHVVLSRLALCEMVWVLSRSYRLPDEEISRTLRGLLDAENVIVDSGAIEAGLMTMAAGADFADGVIAYEGNWLGGETFVSFDKKAVSVLDKQGHRTRLLA